MRLMTQWERKGLTQGLRKGRAEGRAEGKAAGEQAVVLRQLQRRFGRMPNGLADQVRQLGLRQIEALAEALLDFSTVRDLKRWLERTQ